MAAYTTDAGVFSNSAGVYGTYDQGGNVWEWNDAVIDSSRGLRGGSWESEEVYLQSSLRFPLVPTDENNDVGFRLATVPEPSTYALALMGAGALWLWRRRKSAGIDGG